MPVPPQVGVSFSKWQLTEAQLPEVLEEVCGKGVVILLYAVAAGEAFIRELTDMILLLWEEVYVLLPGWQPEQSALVTLAGRWARWLPTKPPVTGSRRSASSGLMSRVSREPWQS